LLKAV